MQAILIKRSGDPKKAMKVEGGLGNEGVGRRGTRKNAWGLDVSKVSHVIHTCHIRVCVWMRENCEQISFLNVPPLPLVVMWLWEAT